MAPEVRVDKGDVGRSLAVVGLCLAATGGLVYWGCQDGEPSPAFGLALVVAIVGAWVSILWVIMGPYFFSYHCPVCGQRLPRTTPGAAARYHCVRCNVVWDLFFRPGDGG